MEKPQIQQFESPNDTYYNPFILTSDKEYTCISQKCYNATELETLMTLCHMEQHIYDTSYERRLEINDWDPSHYYHYYNMMYLNFPTTLVSSYKPYRHIYSKHTPSNIKCDDWDTKHDTTQTHAITENTILDKTQSLINSTNNNNNSESKPKTTRGQKKEEKKINYERKSNRQKRSSYRQRKFKRRNNMSHEQTGYFKSKFQMCSYPDRKMIKRMSRETGVGERSVRIWFQNYRSKLKRDNMQHCIRPKY